MGGGREEGEGLEGEVGTTTEEEEGAHQNIWEEQQEVVDAVQSWEEEGEASLSISLTALRKVGVELPAWEEAGLPALEEGAGLPAWEEGVGLPAWEEEGAGLPAWEVEKVDSHGLGEEGQSSRPPTARGKVVGVRPAEQEGVEPTAQEEGEGLIAAVAGIADDAAASSSAPVCPWTS